MKKRKNDVASAIEENAVKAEKRKAKHSGGSLIGYLLDKLSSAIYKALVGGLFGYIFSSYYTELDAFENGTIYHTLRGSSGPRRFLKRVRGYFANSIESSYIVKLIRKGICGLTELPTKSYGRFSLSFGIYTLLFYFVKLLLPSMGTANSDHLYIGIAFCAIGIPLLVSDKTLAQATYESKISKFIFADFLGYREELFKVDENAKPHRFSGQAMFLGLILGVLTFFVHPAIIIGCLAIFVVCALIFVTPEAGILLSVFFLPFICLTEKPTVIITAATLVTTISYLIKLIRGKRIIRMEIVDIAVVFFMISIYLSGYISAGGNDSYLSALVSCCLLLGYFLIVNLIRTEDWLNRCICTVVVSGSITALIGIIQYVLGYAINDWLDTSMFSDIYGRATSTFENPNYLAAYLTIVFPFALYIFNKARGHSQKILATVSCVFIALCVVFTWSRAAWIAIIVSFVVYLVIATRKSFKYILGTLVIMPLIAVFMPNNVINRFVSIGNTADSSTLYRIYTWNGCTNMIKDYFWGGIGYGQSAFEQIYPLYAFSGIETAVHSHNLYLQILITMGIGGLLCFAVVLFFFTQNCLSYVRDPFNRSTSMIASASLISTLSMLIIGFFDFVWYNNLIFFMFWAVIALGVACARIGKRELARDVYVSDTDERSSSINLYI